MIYVNDEQVDLRGESRAAKEYKEALKFFSEVGWPLKFRVKKQYLARNETEDGKVFMVMASHNISHTSLIHTEFGSEQWRYTPIAPHMKRGDLVYPQEGKRKAYDKKVFTLPREKSDLAFFLWFKSKIFKSIYDLDDAKRNAKEIVDAKMNAIRLNSIFYGDNSVLRESEKLRTVARAYNVPKSDSMTDDQVLINLEGVINGLIKEKQLTVDEFAESLDLDVLTELSAKIQKAEDDKLILFDEPTLSWSYVNEGGTIGEKIVQVPLSKKNSKNNFLRDTLKADQRKLDIFEAHVNSDANTVLTIDKDH